MKIKTYTLTCWLVAVNIAGWAQQPGPGGPGTQHRGAPDLMAENFFPPELIMQNQKALNLTADQQTAIRAEMQKLMAKFTDLQWQQSAESEALAGLLKQERIDETPALAQLDKLLAIENDVKRLHFGTMVRVKNILTTEQQTQLRELKKQNRPAATMRDRGTGKPGEGDGDRSAAAGARDRGPGKPGEGAQGDHPRPPQE